MVRVRGAHIPVCSFWNSSERDWSCFWASDMMAIGFVAVFSFDFVRDGVVETNGGELLVVVVPFLTVVGEVDVVLAGDNIRGGRTARR